MTAKQRFDLVLFTIGHSNHELAHFTDLLDAHGITHIADVRSVPYSKFMTDFTKDTLSAFLRAHGFTYSWVGDRLVFSDPGFREGLVDLMRTALRKPTVIMCAEEDPRRCHRHKLIATALLRQAIPECRKLDSITVLHIRANGSTGDASGLEVAVQGVLPF